MKKTVSIGKGLGTISFGTSKDDLLSLMGPADEIEEISFEEEGGGKAEVWHYDGDEVSFSFEEEYDWMLTSIACSAEEIDVDGEQLINLDKTALMDKLKSMSYNDLVNEDLSDEEFDQELISSDEKSINFWLEDGVLKEVQFGPFIDEEGEYIIE